MTASSRGDAADRYLAAAAALAASALRLGVGVAVDKIREDEERKDDKEDYRCQRVHLGRDGLFRHVVDAYRQSLEAVARGEVADDEVVEREGEGHYHAGHDTGHDLRQLNFEERAHRRAAEVRAPLPAESDPSGAALAAPARMTYGRQKVTCEMSIVQKLRLVAAPNSRPTNTNISISGDTGDDVGVYHGDIRHGVHRRLQVLVAHTVDADSGGGAHDGGDHRSAEREDKRIPDGTERLRVLHKLTVPIEGEAGQDGKALGAR